MQIQVNVNDIKILKNDNLNENEYNIHDIQFVFSNEYTNNLAKIALFTANETTYKVLIINNACEIPPEILANKGCFTLGVYAFETNGDDLIERYSPSPIRINILDGSYIADENTENSEPLSPTDKEQIETLISQFQEELNEKIQEINIAVTQANNLNLDVNKVEKTTTVTLTKKDGAVKRVEIDDGIGLEFMWQGTSLGIKTDNEESYTFVDLQGIQGEKGDTGAPFVIKKTYPSIQAMNADFNNMQVGDYVMIAGDVQSEDNAKLFTRGETQWIFISDFSGAQGIQGPVGATPNIQIGTVISGATPSVTRTGTNENPVLNFVLQKGDKGATGEKGDPGATGNGIATIEKTGTSGLVDTYTITYTNGNTTTFTVTNGEDGEVTQNQLDAVQSQVDNLKQIISQMPSTSDEGTGPITLNNTINAQFLQFDVSGNSVQPTKSYKGLFRVPETLTQEINGLKLIVNNDGSVTAIGTTTQATTIDVLLTAPVVLNGTYTLSLKTVGTISTNGQMQWLLYGGTLEHKTALGLNPGVYSNTTREVTNTVDNTATILRIYCTNAITMNCTIYPILEEGSTETDWDVAETHYLPTLDYNEPVGCAGDLGTINETIKNQDETETQSYNIPCQQPMKKIGTLQDKFVKSNGTWYERHYVGRYFFDEHSTLPKLNSTRNVVFQLTSISSSIQHPASSSTLLETMSNCFRGIFTANEIFGQDIIGLGVTGGGSVNIGLGLNSTISTSEALLEELISKNAFIDYPLAIPLDLQCTSQQIAVLENLPSSYSGQTNISTTDETPAYLKVKALLDLNSLINS